MTPEHEKIIIDIDREVKTILAKAGDIETLLTSLLLESVHSLKRVMDAAGSGELNLYTQRYDGFYYYMKLLEEMALHIFKGQPDVSGHVLLYENMD